MTNKFLIGVIVVLLIGFAGYVLLEKSVGKKTDQKATISHAENENANPTYSHVHSLVAISDSTFLMGIHNGLYKSTDQGKTFTKVEVKGELTASDFMNFAYDSQSKILYAGGHDLGVVKSLDGGLTWIKADTGIKGTDIHAITINPLEPTRLYVFSVDNGVFGTKDGAKSWYRIDDGPQNPSVRSFGYMATPSSMDKSMGTVNTTNIGYLWAGTSGGLFSSFACMCGWTKTAGISDNATIYSLSADLTNKSTMFAGTKEGIFKTNDEGKTFIKINQEIQNVAAIIVDQSNPKVLFVVTENGAFYRSENEGQSFNKVS